MPVNKRIESDRTEKGQRIFINDKTYGMHVTAPLPESFGIGVGSEIGSPFSGFASDGSAAKILALTTGTSNRIGIITKKLFMGADQPDIAIDLKFDAFYSGFDEVVLPCFKLMHMAVGTSEKTVDTVLEKLREFASLEVAVDQIHSSITGNKTASSISDLIQYIRTPGLVSVRFGNTFKLSECFLSNVNINFSNVLDSEFFPMSATASVTITPQDPLVKDRLIDSFSITDRSYRKGNF